MAANIVCLGIDLAKDVFALHGVDAAGRVALRRPSVPRDQLLEVVAQLPPCLIGMEACSGAHHWARLLRDMGLDARLIAGHFVGAYRMGGRSGKNDAADAAAICEAASRPTMRFVPIKSVDQQAILSVHQSHPGFAGRIRFGVCPGSGQVACGAA